MNYKTKTSQKINADFTTAGEVVRVEVAKIVFPIPKKSAQPVEEIKEVIPQTKTAFTVKKSRIKWPRVNGATFVVALIISNSMTFALGSVITTVLNQSRIDIHREL